MTREDLNAILADKNVSNVELADLLGISQDKVSKSRSDKGIRRWTAEEFARLKAYLDRGTDMSSEPDLPSPAAQSEYVAVEILPTFGGMGGGGTGEGDRKTALVPRALVVDALHGKADDFLLINVRGDSMEPDFHHGDQLLIDCRDRSTSQPGPFALWDGEWGEYVVKNIERMPGGRVRMFSSNKKYSSSDIESDQTRIIGRPVWFGRRL